MIMLIPLEHEGDIKIMKLETYDNYRMMYDFLLLQCKRKRIHGSQLGWRLTTGRIPLTQRAENIGVIS